MMSLFAVLKSFINNLMTTKSRECRSALGREQHSSPYRRMGRHLLFTNWRVTSSEAILPTLPKIAFIDRINERLALVTEHLNCRPLIMYVPKYRISLTPGSQAILLFPYQTGWRYSNGNPPNENVECKGYDKMTIFNQYFALTEKRFQLDGHIQQDNLQASNSLSIHIKFSVIAPGASPGETKMW